MLEIPDHEIILRCHRSRLTFTCVLLQERIFGSRWSRLSKLIYRSRNHSRWQSNLNWMGGVVDRAWLFNSTLSTVKQSQMLIRIPRNILSALRTSLGESLLDVGKLRNRLTVIHK